VLDRTVPLLAGALLLLHAPGALAQSSTGGTPPSFARANEATLLSPVPVVTLPTVDVATYRSEDERSARRKDVPWRFGALVEVDLGLDNAGEWEQLTDGSWLWRLAVESPGALTLNFIFSEYELPPGARLFLYTPDREHILGAFTEANNQAAGVFATTLIDSDLVVLEYHEPASVPFPGLLRLGSVTHGYRYMKAYGERGLGDSGSCNNNVHCPESAGWEDPIRSVVLLLEGGDSFCTGALVNNTAFDGTPYVLTANHCYSNPATWVVWFNWESPTCNNPNSSPPHDALSGAVLRARRYNSDFCLVELNDEIPSDFDTFFAGFDASGATPSSTVGIHHPAGDIKKISFDDDAPGISGYFGGGTDHWEVYDWDDGTTEWGSSGSPLFDQDQRIVGQLHGGSASCSNDLEDYYGRLSVSWDGASAGSRLRDWLDPTGSGATSVDGYDGQPDTVNDAALQAILEPGDGLTYCDGTLAPEVEIRNRGSAPLTSVDILWAWDSSPPTTTSWTGNLAHGATATVALASTVLSDGSHTFTASTSNPNGVADENPANDERSASIDVQSGPGRFLPYALDFEGGPFPPVGVTLGNPDGWYTWERSDQVGGYGDSSASAFVNNYDEDFSGQSDLFILPAMNFSSILSPVNVEFAVAYARYDRNLWDALAVRVSTDCGQTWTEEFYKENRELSTTGHNESGYFVPSDSQWRTETVNLDGYIGQPAVIVAFENISGYGNVLYIDDVEVSGVLPDIDDDNDGWTQAAGDCNDADASIHPGATEVPDDGVDQDCSGTDSVTCIVDDDGDGYGNDQGLTTIADDGSCEAAEGEATSADDCDDSQAAINPGVPEDCEDTVDNDCDTLVDCADDDCTDQAACGGCHDDDGDGFLDHLCGGADCDDTDDTVYPDAAEVCDGLDNDCDEVVPDNESDRDGDGVRHCGGDCDDLDAGRYPGAEELCNGVDDDCDGAVPNQEQDADGDLVSTCEGDCDDDNDLVSPAMPELCNDDADNDCNGEINDDCPVVIENGGCSCTTSSAGGLGVSLWLPTLGWVFTRRRRPGAR
jgi:hypothetical protein